MGVKYKTNIIAVISLQTQQHLLRQPSLPQTQIPENVFNNRPAVADFPEYSFRNK